MQKKNPHSRKFKIGDISVKNFFRFFFLCSLLMGIHFQSQAQFYQGMQQTFGKNRVQYNDFFWTYHKYKFYDVYFYQGGQETALWLGKSAFKELKNAEKILDYKLEGRLQFIVYNKLSELRQGNIGLETDDQFNTGGVTRIVGNKIFIYNSGSHEDMMIQIRAGIANVLVDQIMYGGSIRERIQNAALLTIPDWYAQGLISYLSEKWSTRLDNQLKDGILSNRYAKINRLSGSEAVVAGHSIWKYLADTYGESVISSLLYMTSVNRNIESGFVFVLGTTFKSLIPDWFSYYQNYYSDADQKKTLPDMKPFFIGKKPGIIYTQLKTSPSGDESAFVSNESGKYKVFICQTKTNKKRKILKSGYRSMIQKMDDSYPLLAWHPSGKSMALIRERKGKIWLGIYDTKTKKLDENPLINFEKIIDFSFSDDGQSIVMSAIQKGQTDIFVYNLRSRTYEQITKDFYDDHFPHFVNKSSAIAFSSNRQNDTLGAIEKDISPDRFSGKMDLFVYDYKHKSKVLRRITNTPEANETGAFAFDSSRIGFLSDENGIVNMYSAQIDSAISFVDTSEHYRYIIQTHPQTNYARNILSIDINRNRKFSMLIFKDGKYQMLSGDLQKSFANRPLPETKFMNAVVALHETDSLKKVQGEKNKQAETFLVTPSYPKTDSSQIDINNYTFQSEKIRQKKQTDVISSPPVFKAHPDTNILGKSKSFLSKQRNYDVSFSANYVVFQLDNSLMNNSYQAFTGGPYYDPGLTGLLKIGTSDLFEDFKITGALRFSGDLNSNEYYMSFQNLKKRMDKQFVFYRQSRLVDDAITNSLVRVQTHEFKYVTKWPFSEVSAIRGTLSYRNDRKIYLSTDLINLKQPNEFQNRVYGKLEWIYDNTISTGLNLYNGTRMKFFGEIYKQLDNKNTYMTVLGFDVRNYLKVHRDIIWANRMAASASFGQEKLVYYLGAVDNWFSPKFNYNTQIDNTQNFVFQALASNMRGFDQNIRNGSNFAVVNSELRVPIFKYLWNAPIKSDFFKNFQVIGFADGGTAWNGWSPYSENNSLNTKTIVQGPLTIKITSQQEPLVGGLGWGLRSRILGYFVRTDWAWGYENGEFQPRMFYLSLNLDF